VETASSPSRFHDSVGRYIRATIKRLLPDSTIHELRRYQKYGGKERLLYFKIRAMNTLRLTSLKSSRPPKTARSFLFVCFGNIMRSPMCEALMKQALASMPSAQFSVRSAGLNATPGRPAPPWATTAAQDFGISLEHHRARLLTADMVDQADAIFAMDYDNLTQLQFRYPHARDKVFMLGAYARDYPAVEIKDPYYSGEGATLSCYKILSGCVQHLIATLQQ